MLIWIKNTRAWTLLKGIVFILAFFLAAAILELDTILWLLEKTSYIAVTAIIVIFQPELRKALEQIGSQNVPSDRRGHRSMPRCDLSLRRKVAVQPVFRRTAYH